MKMTTTSAVQDAARDLQEAFNQPFWRGSPVERSVFVLAEFIAEFERSIYAKHGVTVDRQKPRLRVKMGRAVV